MRRWLTCSFALLIALATLAPILGPPEDDGFPLSTYPMFSRPRAQVTSLSTAVGYRTDGERLELSPTVIGGTREVIQASTTVAQEIAAGTGDRFCREVLDRAPQDVATVEIVTETYDVVAYFDGTTEPQQRAVHARCTP